MSSHDDTFSASGQPSRPPYRPPIGMPARRESYRIGTVVSLVLHGIALIFILAPLFVATMLAAPPEGAGGAGPAGGGGGGRGGTGGASAYTPEGLRYIQIAPAPAPAPEAEETEPEPAVVPPPPEPEPEPEPEPPISQQVPSAPPAEPLVGSADVQVGSSTAPTPGTGGGTGHDGTSGSGPGSGGGIGSGVGTGIGSGDGPGTGGGAGDVYLPTPIVMAMVYDPPRSVKGDTVRVLFDVDTSGRVLRIEVEPTRDRGFNRRVLERMREWRFRPAVRPDGTPVRATYPAEFIL